MKKNWIVYYTYNGFEFQHYLFDLTVESAVMYFVSMYPQYEVRKVVENKMECSND